MRSGPSSNATDSARRCASLAGVTSTPPVGSWPPHAPRRETAGSRVSALARRLTAQLLAGRPARDPVDAVRRLLAVQGQDPRGARLAIRARTSGVRADEVDHALTHDRSLLITWLNRGTLHLVASEDYSWLHALTAPALATSNRTRLAQSGVSPDQAERAVALVGRQRPDDGTGAARAAAQRGDPDRRPGLRPRDVRRFTARQCRARADDRPPARVRAGRRLAARRRPEGRRRPRRGAGRTGAALSRRSRPGRRGRPRALGRDPP